MSKCTIALIRHGESLSNTGIWSNTPEIVPLTTKGMEQAKKAAQQIKKRPNLIVTSPFLRAQQTAEPIRKRWPKVLFETWNIQEFTYLASKKCQNKTTKERQSIIQNYWQHCDPYFCDGDEAESFAHFMQRVINFHQHLSRQQGFVIVFGHGQFFKAYLLGLEKKFPITSEWMREFRTEESLHPIANGEIITIKFE